MMTIKPALFLDRLRPFGILSDNGRLETNMGAVRAKYPYSRFWEMPVYAGKWPYLFASLLSAFGDWKEMYIWPLAGQWPGVAAQGRWGETVRDTMWAALGIPPCWDGAICCRREELSTVLTLLFFVYALSACDQDLVLFPNDGRAIFQTDHHGVIHIAVPSSNDVQRVINTMEQAGFSLPRKVPDDTFMTPDWMQG